VPKENSDHSLVTHSKQSAVTTLRNLANAIEAGTIDSYQVTHTSNGIVNIRADQGDKRIIQKHRQTKGYTRVENEFIEKQSPRARRKTVLELTREGMTQQEIADRTMVSQKTISNDIAKLKELGKL